MEITGTQSIAAPRQRVWDALNDPVILKGSLPGCESVERTSPDEFKVVVAAAIGPLRARFNGVLRMTDVKAPSSCTLVFEGQGGAVGFGKGHSTVQLVESNGQTDLTYTAEAQVGGKLAQVGSRLIDSVARKMSDDFFKAFKAQLAAPPAAAEPTAAAQPAPVPASEKPLTPVAARAGAETAAPQPQPQPQPSPSVAAHVSDGKTAVLVPGWWLAVAAAIGSAATLAGVLIAR